MTEQLPVIEAQVEEIVTEAKLDLSKLEATLINLGHIAATDVKRSEQELVNIAENIVTTYNSVLKNAGVMLVHSKQVFESMISRTGKMPDELVKGSAVFKNREGFADLNTVIDQVLPVFNKPVQQDTPPQA